MHFVTNPRGRKKQNVQFTTIFYFVTGGTIERVQLVITAYYLHKR